MLKDKLLISFSGGRTSAYMTKRLIKESAYKEIVVVFSNTGQEDDRTLEFVNNCDINFGFNTVWVEADVKDGKGNGTKHKIVSYNTASRNGEPFEQVIKKYGIPNQISPHCTRELKQRPITSYARSIGFLPSTYDLAIGIRYDEVDRVNNSADKQGIIYPLINWKINKQDVIDFWKKQPFDLDIPEHRGNCLWCWKKSNRKLYTLAHEDVNLFDFPNSMEENYSLRGSVAAKNKEPMQFYRGKRTTKMLLEDAFKTDFNIFSDPNWNPSLDVGGGCGESCEVFTDNE